MASAVKTWSVYEVRWVSNRVQWPVTVTHVVECCLKSYRVFLGSPRSFSTEPRTRKRRPSKSANLSPLLQHPEIKRRYIATKLKFPLPSSKFENDKGNYHVLDAAVCCRWSHRADPPFRTPTSSPHPRVRWAPFTFTLHPFATSPAEVLIGQPEERLPSEFVCTRKIPHRGLKLEIGVAPDVQTPVGPPERAEWAGHTHTHAHLKVTSVERGRHSFPKRNGTKLNVTCWKAVHVDVAMW